jgi:hypothetical protein
MYGDDMPSMEHRDAHVFCLFVCLFVCCFFFFEGAEDHFTHEEDRGEHNNFRLVQVEGKRYTALVHLLQVFSRREPNQNNVMVFIVGDSTLRSGSTIGHSFASISPLLLADRRGIPIWGDTYRGVCEIELWKLVLLHFSRPNSKKKS